MQVDVLVLNRATRADRRQYRPRAIRAVSRALG
jgi:hypothetical protein